VEGPETTDNGSKNGVNDGGLTGGGGIPGAIINPVLTTDYTVSSSYADSNYLNSMATQNLMRGVARHETQCRQFETPLEELPQGSADILGPWIGVPLWGVLQIQAKWPTQNTPTKYARR
jgi:hypothetical protein